MNPREQDQERTEPQTAEAEGPEHTSAPPIEREHETYAGVFEEDEKREHHASSANDVY